MSLWFSASAVVPALVEDWSITGGSGSWLTGAVQLGFVAGALLSASLNLADRVSPRVLIGTCALGGAATNGAVALLAEGLSTAVPLRFLTGVFLAGIYPTGMKLAASWFRRGRGLAIGVVVGALTLGSGTPHLINGVGDLPWQGVLVASSALALAGGAFALAIRPGPHARPSPPLDVGYAVRSFRERPLRLANLGYFGHMWEIYAVWTWLPVYLAATLDSARGAALLAFVAIGLAGASGCLVAGLLADRVGRTSTTIAAMAVSGVCCLAAPAVFGAHPAVVVALALIWSFAVVADSAQFSAAVTELADPRYVGTALTVQTAIGFLLTVGSIRLVGAIGESSGWRWAFPVLAVGPALGALAMYRLRHDPAAARLAQGVG